MSIFVIADLHLSLRVPKPMDIFGDNWSGHEEKIKKDWLEKVKENDLVILPGDFSWETYLENTKLDFGYLNSLPGKKLMLKGNQNELINLHLAYCFLHHLLHFRYTASIL